MEAEAELRVIDNSGSAVLLEQARGSILYDIHPGGPRRWTIDCGLLRVEVTGTSFWIHRTLEQVTVSVNQGSVRVMSALLSRGEAVLTAGMTLQLPPILGVDQSGKSLPSPLSPATSTSSARPASSPAFTAGPPPVLPWATRKETVASAESIGWKVLAKRGDNASAYAALGKEGIERTARVASVDDLFALADLARRSGHPVEAVLPLQRLLDEFPSHPQTSVAAFTLGRVQLELGAVANAARSFQRAITLGVPGGLAEDAFRYLVGCRLRSGDRQGAQAAYDEYRARFPNGTQAPEMRAWLERK
ncbi:MAG: hypothetical protein NVSMB1_25680 [Polyangiales bacterium]